MTANKLHIGDIVLVDPKKVRAFIDGKLLLGNKDSQALAEQVVNLKGMSCKIGSQYKVEEIMTHTDKSISVRVKGYWFPRELLTKKTVIKIKVKTDDIIIPTQYIKVK